METKSVYLHELSGILQHIKRSKAPIKIYNRSGQWLDHFFSVLEIKEISAKNYQVTVLILFHPETGDSTAIDIKSISRIELQSVIDLEAKPVKKIRVVK